MQRPITRGASAGAGLIFHVFVQDSASTVGAGKASVAYSSFSCRYIRNGEAISGAITPEDITTIGTYAAPTANTNIRIKAVDNTNMIGVYEIQIHADWVNTTNSCQSLTIYLTATGVAVLPFQVPLEAINRQDTVRMGLTALPNAAADAAGGLPLSDAGGLDLDTKFGFLTGDAYTRLGAPAGASVSADVAAVKSDTAATLVDTNELQTDWANGGRLDLILDARASQTSVDDLPTNAELATALTAADDAVLSAIAALNNLSAAQVATEIADALATDTHAEPNGVPAATATLATKLGYLYMALRNRVDVNSSTGKKQFFDDGGAAEWEKDLTDDGTTYSESEGNAP